MNKNMGTIDRVIRLLVAATISIFIYTGQLRGGWAMGLGAIAVIFIVTALAAKCPLYGLFGKSFCTCRNEAGKTGTNAPAQQVLREQLVKANGPVNKL